MRLKNHGKCLFFLWYSLLIFGIFQYSIHKIFGMVYYPDEFGYWANAAGWLGYDWSTLTALGSYYSFGYSLLLAPIMKIFSGGTLAYRVAIGVNMLLQAGSIPLLYRIFRRVFPQADGQAAVCAVGISLFYPVWIFYGQSTMAEGVLFFLYIWIVYLMSRTIEKAQFCTILCLMAALVYLCFVHMRTVGVMVAAVLLLLCRLWKEPVYRKRLLMGFGLLVAGGVLGVALRLAVLRSVYGNTDKEMLARNDITGQLARVFAIFSREGAKKFLCGCAGKLFYLGAASFGLLYYALFWIGRKVLHLAAKIRQRKMVVAEEWLALFLLLSFAGQFLVTAIYLYSPRRADEVVYGRYNDYLLPVFMGVGYLVLSGSRHYGRKVLAAIMLQSAMLPVVLYGEKMYGGSEVQGYFMAGIGYLVDDLHFDIVPDMVQIFLLASLLMMFVAIGVWAGRKMKATVPAMALIMFMEIVLGTWLNHKYTYRFNDLIYMELQVSDYIGQGEDETPAVYLYEGGIPYIDTVQFNLPGRKIDVLEQEAVREISAFGIRWEKEGTGCGTAGYGGYLILDIESAYRQQVEQYCEPCAEGAYFVLYDWR